MNTVAKLQVKWRRSILFAAILLAMFATVPFLWQIYWRVPGWVDFLLHRSEYQRIVDAVKSPGIAPETREKEIKLAGYLVWVQCTDNGNYTVTIQTADWGHLGTVGYVYADVPPPKVTTDPYRTFDVPGRLPFVGKRLSLHWWTVYNNLY